MKCGPVYVFVCSRICRVPCKRTEAVSHESGFARRRSLGLSRFARSHTTHNRRCNKVNLLLRDVILVNFGVHMCAHYLSVLFLFLRLKERQIHIERITRPSLCELPSGEATFGRNDPIPCKRGSEGMLIVCLNFPVDDSFVRSKQFASGSSFK